MVKKLLLGAVAVIGVIAGVVNNIDAISKFVRPWLTIVQTGERALESCDSHSPAEKNQCNPKLTARIAFPEPFKSTPAVRVEQLPSPGVPDHFDLKPVDIDLKGFAVAMYRLDRVDGWGGHPTSTWRAVTWRWPISHFRHTPPAP